MTSSWIARANAAADGRRRSRGRRGRRPRPRVDVLRVAAAVRLEAASRSAAPRSPPGELADRRPGGEGLEAAVAGRTRSSGAARLEDDVADLAGQAARAAMERAVEHDAGGDAGADAEVGEVVVVADDAAGVEAGGRGADVVLDADGNAERAPRAAGQRQVVPAEVDRERDGAGRGVDAAGDADADRGRSSGRAPASARAASSASAICVDGASRRRRRGRGDVAADGPRRPRRRRGPRSCCRRRRRRRGAASWPRCEVAASSCTASGRARVVMSRADAPSSDDVSVAGPPSIDPGLAASSASERRAGLVADRREPRLAEVGDAAVEDDSADVERRRSAPAIARPRQRPAARDDGRRASSSPARAAPDVVDGQLAVAARLAERRPRLAASSAAR